MSVYGPIEVLSLNPVLLLSGTAYFMALAASDVMFLVCTTIAYSCQPIKWYMEPTEPWDLLTKGDESWAAEALVKVYPVMEISQVLVSLYILAASMDHYVFMFKTRRSGDESASDTSQKLIVLIFGLVVLSHLPQIFKRQIETITVAGNSWVKLCISTLYLTDFVQFYERWAYVGVFALIPTLSSISVNIAIQVRFWYNNRGPENDEEREFAVMRDGRSRSAMMAMSTVRFFLTSPYIVIRIMTSVTGDYNYALLRCSSDTARISYVSETPALELAALTCLVIDSAFRFLTYAIFHKEFDKRLSKLCTKKKRNTESPPFKPRSRGCICCRDSETSNDGVYAISPSTRMAVPVAAPPYRERAYAPRTTVQNAQPVPMQQFSYQHHNDLQPTKRDQQRRPRDRGQRSRNDLREDDFDLVEPRGRYHDNRRDPAKIDNRISTNYNNPKRNNLSSNNRDYKGDNHAYVHDDSMDRYSSDEQDYVDSRRDYRRNRQDQSYMWSW